MKKQTRRLWSLEEDRYLQKHYLKTTAEKIGRKLGRTKYAVTTRAGVLGLSVKRNTIKIKPKKVSDKINIFIFIFLIISFILNFYILTR